MSMSRIILRGLVVALSLSIFSAEAMAQNAGRLRGAIRGRIGRAMGGGRSFSRGGLSRPSLGARSGGRRSIGNAFRSTPRSIPRSSRTPSFNRSTPSFTPNFGRSVRRFSGGSSRPNLGVQSRSVTPRIENRARRSLGIGTRRGIVRLPSRDGLAARGEAGRLRALGNNRSGLSQSDRRGTLQLPGRSERSGIVVQRGTDAARRILRRSGDADGPRGLELFGNRERQEIIKRLQQGDENSILQRRSATGDGQRVQERLRGIRGDAPESLRDLVRSRLDRRRDRSSDTGQPPFGDRDGRRFDGFGRRHHHHHHRWHHGHWHFFWKRPWFWWPIVRWAYGPSVYYYGYYPYYNPYFFDPYVVAGGTVLDYRQPVAGADYGDDLSPQEQQALAYLERAREAFKRGAYDTALQQVDRALALVPGDPVLHEFRALVLFATGEYSEAAATIHAVLAVGPGWDWATLSGLYPSVPVYTEHLRALEAFNRENPESADARFLLAYHYLTCGHTDAAARQLRRVTESQPDDRVAARLLEMLTGESGTPPQAPVPQVQPPESSTSTPEDSVVKFKPADLPGRWNAVRDDGSSFALVFSEGDKFEWTFRQGEETRTLKGSYHLADDVLVLESEQGGVMVGRVTGLDKTKFRLVLLGGPPDDPGLEFEKADS